VERGDNLLYIFNPDEELIALLKPDFTRSNGPASTTRGFLMAEYPAEFDREPVEGCPYWGAKHREVLNGENTFSFTVPGGQADAAYVTEGNLVAFKDLDSYWQIFEIKRLVDTHGDGLTRTAYCEHIFYELLDDIVTDKRPSADATAALAGMLDNTRWQVGTVDDLGASSTTAYYISALEAVQDVANAWKGELNWRCVISGGVITRYVDLRAMRGTDTGKQFAYSKDILNIEREVDTSGVITALYGRGKGVEVGDGTYGRRLTFADVVADDKPLGQEWVGDNEALAQWGRPGGRHRFDVFIDEEETDPAKLLEKTRAELAKRKVPRVTYRLDAVSLEELTKLSPDVSGEYFLQPEQPAEYTGRTGIDYSHEAVRLGDLTRVIDREFRPELIVSARVVEIERDLLDPSRTIITLGSFAPTIVDATINTARRVEEMANRPYNTRWLDGKISVLQNEIENTGAFVFQTPGDGILILNAATYDVATKAMKLGGGIFAIANQKDGNGGWNWRTFGDGAGFTADELNAGKVKAELIQIGESTTFAEGYDPTTKETPEGAQAKANAAQAAAEAVAAQKFDSPGYVTATPEGIKVFDADDNLRVLVGSWLLDAIRKYGIKIIDGEIYSSLIQTSAPAPGEAGYYSRVGGLGRDDIMGYYQAPDGTTSLNYVIATGGNGGTITLYQHGRPIGQIIGYLYNSDVFMTIRRLDRTADFELDDYCKGVSLNAGVDGAELRLMASSKSTVLRSDFDVIGNMSCTGSKPAQQVTDNFGIRYLYATEAPEVIYYDRGVVHLTNGEATVLLDPIYLECIEPDTELTPWQVWVQCYGENDVYVSEVGDTFFKVKERNGGTSNSKVVWKHEAIRKGYAGIRLMEATRDD
jgi:phage minor structural protein